MPGKMKEGVEKIRGFIDDQGLSRKDYVFVNPSGLTIENKIRPEHLGQIMLGLKKDFRSFPEFLSGLPIAGVDGTLKKRMDASEGLIRAKTGLLKMAGVASLAGFAARPDGNIITFVFMYNEGKELSNLDRIWKFFDSLAMNLVKE